jgi:hypothetical protein
VIVPKQALATSQTEEGSPVERLARFFPAAAPVRIPVNLAAIDAWESAPAENALRESTVIEYGTPREVLFASSLPLEFDDKMRLENSDGSLFAEASVVALQYHGGFTVVAARFSRPLAHWIIK